MTITRFFTDRLTIAALALTAILPFAALTPVHAGTAQCAVQAEQLRTEAASANPQDAAKALRSIKIAEKICAEGNSHEAAKKFAQARTQLASNMQFAERR
jgi:hypothetical protein